jgi:hypothetical protein
MKLLSRRSVTAGLGAAVDCGCPSRRYRCARRCLCKVKWGGRNPPNVLVSIKPIYPGIFVRLGCLGRSASTHLDHQNAKSRQRANRIKS